MISQDFLMTERQSHLMTKVYGWMAAALGITAAVAYGIAHSSWFMILEKNPAIFWGLMLAQLGIVIGLSFFIYRLPFFAAFSMFIGYAALTGVSFSSLFYVYYESSIYVTFAVTGITFAVMALYGYFTKADLTGMGSLLSMVLLGLIIGLVVNLFLQSSRFDFILAAVGVVLFTLLTAYDAQKIKQLLAHPDIQDDMRSRIAVLGALILYLDFINLFISLLRLMGKRRD